MSKEIVDAVIDYRALLDRNDIDAISIATPNHWHALMTIEACNAGKDVYVEKPVSHDVGEGERILEAEAGSDDLRTAVIDVARGVGNVGAGHRHSSSP